MSQETHEIRGSVINLSNLVWTQEAGLSHQRRSVFVAQDFEHPAEFKETGIRKEGKYFCICRGSEQIEYGLNGYPA